MASRDLDGLAEDGAPLVVDVTHHEVVVLALLEDERAHKRLRDDGLDEARLREVLGRDDEQDGLVDLALEASLVLAQILEPDVSAELVPPEVLLAAILLAPDALLPGRVTGQPESTLEIKRDRKSVV